MLAVSPDTQKETGITGMAVPGCLVEFITVWQWKQIRR